MAVTSCGGRTLTELQRSLSTERALVLPRPCWRGVSHRWAAAASIPAGIALVLVAGSVRATVAAAVFSVGMTVMFTASAVVHHRRWSERATEILFRVDHSAIFIAIAAGATPIALLGLRGWKQAALLGVVWLVSIAGIVVEWLPFAPPRGFGNTVYLTLSWSAVVLLPWLWINTGWIAVALLLAGGVCYTVGAVIVGLRRPDPNPEVFGYHEIWHLLVVAAATFHYVLVGVVLLPLS